VRRRDDARGRDAGSVELGEQVYVAVHDVLVADIRDRRR
jgi:antitoxin (DNA-binding transcriptional repressor) of toxin-antitoxin stability system